MPKSLPQTQRFSQLSLTGKLSPAPILAPPSGPGASSFGCARSSKASAAKLVGWRGALVPAARGAAASRRARPGRAAARSTRRRGTGSARLASASKGEPAWSGRPAWRGRFLLSTAPSFGIVASIARAYRPRIGRLRRSYRYCFQKPTETAISFYLIKYLSDHCRRARASREAEARPADLGYLPALDREIARRCKQIGPQNKNA